MKDIITIGSATKDFFVHGSFDIEGERLVLPHGGRVGVDSLHSATGGSGTNAAVTFARQGLQTEALVVLGNDSDGDEIIKELETEGIATGHILRHDDGYTATSFILVDDKGERTILTYKGEGQHLAFISISADILDTKWLYLGSMGGNHDLFSKIIDIASEKNIFIASNPGTLDLKQGLDVLTPFFQKIDIVIINLEEAKMLLNKEVTVESAVTELQPHCKKIVIVTNGREGVAVGVDGHKYRAGTPESPRIDATGAGDAFGSGFVVEFIRSGDIAKAVQFATANATSVVGQFGAKAGILKAGDSGLADKITVEQY